MHRFLVSSLLCTLMCGIDISRAGSAGTTLPGHMQPLGSHRPADPVDEVEVDGMPSPQEFWEKYVKVSRPLVFRGAAKRFPAFTKWTDDYLKEKYGKMELRLEGRREKFGRVQVGAVGLGRDTLENFVSRYHSPECDAYIVSELPKPMFPEVMVLPPMSCGSFKRRLVEVDFWMNGGNASSILHKDAYHQMNCLLNGTKEWKLIEYKNEKLIYKAWEPLPAYGGYSQININAVDMTKYPKVAETPWMFTTLQGGDCLYLPKSMWHHVKSYGTHNMAVSLLFSRWDDRKNLNFRDCKNGTNDFMRLNDTIVDWEYPGYGDMTMGNDDLENVRRQLYDLMMEEGKVTSDELFEVTKRIYQEKSKEFIMARANKTYQILTEGGKVKITKKEIIKMSKEKLREMAWCLERVEPSNSYWLEYNSIAPDLIQEVIQKLLKKGNNRMIREKFLNKYVNRLEGTEKYGHDLFNKLGGEGKDEVTREEVEKNFNDAVQKYYEHQTEGELAAAFGKGFNKSEVNKPSKNKDADVHILMEKDDKERRNAADPEEEEDNDDQRESGDNEDNDEPEGGDNDDDDDEAGSEKQEQEKTDSSSEQENSEKHDEL